MPTRPFPTCRSSPMDCSGQASDPALPGSSSCDVPSPPSSDGVASSHPAVDGYLACRLPHSEPDSKDGTINSTDLPPLDQDFEGRPSGFGEWGVFTQPSPSSCIFIANASADKIPSSFCFSKRRTSSKQSSLRRATASMSAYS